ncbi:MAG: ATPase, T2SS/T4P/T4SS family [Thermoleophilia bacterium]|nr:ATPase, T2SS/T4P/T4SS family [Thermoleophilia bacterium]
MVSRIKIMGDMDIAEKRLPQDGRATYRSPDQTVDLRVASMPTVYGENVTVRLLDESMFEISLEELGMEENELVIFRRAIERPHGQVLITGPTGSGKSTTLYSALAELNEPSVKIYTVEDPVERKMPGILQSQIKPSIGLTFARTLRSLVRGDPDVIMIGEIRDLETATIATEASLTGHLVLSTLHTNDASSTVVRLAEMGVPPSSPPRRCSAWWRSAWPGACVPVATRGSSSPRRAWRRPSTSSSVTRRSPWLERWAAGAASARGTPAVWASSRCCLSPRS